MGTDDSSVTYNPTTQHHFSSQNSLIQFLRCDLAVSEEAIAMALKRIERADNRLPMVLWQYGFITLEQLGQVFDWMEAT
ncbi:MAG: DUF2949 domain-containing protein [Leptolyngbyaceae bacterium]|nr:DUF2949 domain-containing protein [Leptolyngbyaceae bacterium]